MKEIILCKYGEIALKGLNKSSFESMMTKSVKRRLKSCGQFSVSKAQSTLYVEPLNDDSDVDMAVEKLSKIFGIVKLCRCCVLEKDMDEILTKSLDYIEDENGKRVPVLKLRELSRSTQSVQIGSSHSSPLRYV